MQVSSEYNTSSFQLHHSELIQPLIPISTILPILSPSTSFLLSLSPFTLLTIDDSLIELFDRLILPNTLYNRSVDYYKSVIPLTKLYPAFYSCVTFTDCIKASISISTVPTLTDVINNAKILQNHGDIIDFNIIHNDIDYATQFGLLNLFRQRQEKILHRTLKVSLYPTPTPSVPILPIISVSNFQNYIPLDISITNNQILPLLPYNQHIPNLYDMSLFEKRNFLAFYGGPILRHNSFIPNNVIKCDPYPESIAPSSVISVHYAQAQKKRNRHNFTSQHYSNVLY